MRLNSAFAALLLLAAPALAQEDLEAEGRRLVEINCASCHSIEAIGESPLTDAPPFRELAWNYDPVELIDGFMEGLAVRHPLMPDWEVTEPQAEALTAYIMSLKGENQAKEDDSSIILGAELLRQNCAACHAIDMASLSPRQDAPPFREVVKRYQPRALEEALAEGIVTGHNDMPEFEFAPEQVAAIIAYLESLQIQ